MNGDRLQDIVLLQDGICMYWPSSGVGEWDLIRRGDWKTGEIGTGTKMSMLKHEFIFTCIPVS